MRKRAIQVLRIMLSPLIAALKLVYLFTIILPAIDYIIRGEKSLVIDILKADII